MTRRLFLLPLLVAGLGSGCTALASFPADKLSEVSEALCGNEVDDDGDGLMDCQDWKCQKLDTCCDVPLVRLEDDFDGPSCATDVCPGDDACAPDDELWQTWGTPFPRLCEGGLLLAKQEANCYPVGVLGRVPLPYRPGLDVRVTTAGRPEIAGRLNVGLTLQNEITGSTHTCTSIDTVFPLVSVTQVQSDGGSRFVAYFESEVLAQSDQVAENTMPEIGIVVADDRRVHYLLNGAEFALSPEELPADSPAEARLVLWGIGATARFQSARAVTGSQCEAPTAWTPAATPVARAHGAANAWDSTVFAPEVIQDGDELLLHHGTCRLTSGQCGNMAIGQSRAPVAGEFVAGQAHLFEADDLRVGDMGTALPTGWAELTVARVGADALRGFFSFGARGYFIAGFTFSFTEPEPGNADLSVSTGDPGAWDDHAVCCATAVEHEGTVRLWYAGRSKRDETWRIGLATSTDGGVTFEKEPDPVLKEGLAGSFDDRGVTQPSVLWDDHRKLYRMWYEAQAFQGKTTVGYTASPDGVTWYRPPENEPVVTPDVLGLAEIGAPAVFFDGRTLRMWVHGAVVDDAANGIYELENIGTAFTEQ